MPPSPLSNCNDGSIKLVKHPLRGGGVLISRAEAEAVTGMAMLSAAGAPSKEIMEKQKRLQLMQQLGRNQISQVQAVGAPSPTEAASAASAAGGVAKYDMDILGLHRRVDKMREEMEVRIAEPRCSCCVQ